MEHKKYIKNCPEIRRLDSTYRDTKQLEGFGPPQLLLPNLATWLPLLNPSKGPQNKQKSLLFKEAGSTLLRRKLWL